MRVPGWRLWVVVGVLSAALTLGVEATAAVRDGESAKLAGSHEWLAARQDQQAQAGCAYSTQMIDTASGAPVAGARATLVETGASAVTDDTGTYTLPVPGAGAWTIQVSHPEYPTLTGRIEIGPDCALIGSSPPSPGPSARPGATPAPAMPRPPASPASNMPTHRFSGQVSIDDGPAPHTASVIARVGERECGRARIDTTGRFNLSVLDASRTPGCGTPGATVQLSVQPSFGSGWPLSQTYAYQAGGVTTTDLAVDLRMQPADAENVPLLPQLWDNLGAVLIAPCGEAGDETLQAATAAVNMWLEASDNGGLLARLDPHPDACRDEVNSIVIGEVDLPDQPGLVGAQVAVDRSGRLCNTRARTPCKVHTSFIALNRAEFGSIDARERANILAHEIGHALGLDHSLECNGGTIMWEDTQCRFPLTHIGVDDIAALNRRYDETAPVAAAPDAAAYRSVAGSSASPGDAPSSLADMMAARGLTPADLLAGAIRLPRD